MEILVKIKFLVRKTVPNIGVFKMTILKNVIKMETENLKYAQ